MKKYFITSIATFTCLLSLTYCITVGPNYEPPETAVPDEWHAAIEKDLSSDSPSIQGWWTVFGDETLNSLITR
jgi:outer membrane protein TolC